MSEEQTSDLVATDTRNKTIKIRLVILLRCTVENVQGQKHLRCTTISVWVYIQFQSRYCSYTI